MGAASAQSLDAGGGEDDAFLVIGVGAGPQARRVGGTCPLRQADPSAGGSFDKRILRLTTPKLKKALGAPFAQDDTSYVVDDTSSVHDGLSVDDASSVGDALSVDDGLS